MSRVRLRTLALALLAGCGKPAAPSGPAPQPAPAPQAQADPEAERLKGTWRVVAIVAAGKPVPREKVDAIRLDWVFDGDRITTRRPDRPAEPATFALDPTAAPKRMTVNKPGLPPIRAVYELDGATLRLCLLVDDNPEAGFPPALASTAAPKTDVLTLERR